MIPTIAIILMIAGVFSQALHNVSQTYALKQKLTTKAETLAYQYALAAPLLLGYFVFVGRETGVSIANSLLFWGSVVGIVVSNLVIQSANVEARHIADTSLTTPIQGMTPFLVIFTAAVLDEWPGVMGRFGIACIAVGTWVHGRENARTLRDYLMPFTMLRLPSDFAERSLVEQDRLRKDVRALRFAYLSAAAGSVGLLFGGLNSRSGSVALGLGAESVIVALIFGMRLVGQAPSPVQPEKRQVRRVMIGLLGLFWAMQAIFPAMAFRLAPIAYIGSFKRLSVVVVAVLAWVILGEKKAKRRFWPALIIAVGAVLIGMDPASNSVVDRSYEFLSGH